MVYEESSRNISTGIASGNKLREKNYWLSKLEGEPVKTHFPYDFPRLRHHEQRRDYTSAGFTLKGKLFSRIMDISGGSDPRLLVILAASLTGLLQKYLDHDDIILAVPADKQEKTGHFVNTTLLLRNTIKPGQSFKELLLQTAGDLAQASQHVNYPMETLLHRLNLPFRPHYDFPLSDVALLLENIHDKSYIGHLHFNTLFSFRRTNKQIEAILEYNAALYENESILGIIARLQSIMETAVNELDSPLSGIQLFSEEEKAGPPGHLMDADIKIPPGTDIFEGNTLASPKNGLLFPLKPAKNRFLEIKDRQGNTRPIGLPGLLYTGNVKEKQNQLQPSGLSARWTRDGRIQLLGYTSAAPGPFLYHIDHTAIRQQLMAVEGITDAAALVKKNNAGKPCLCACLVMDEAREKSIDRWKLWERLSTALPFHMIPGYFIRFDLLPLASNGKIDPEQLPIPGPETWTVIHNAPSEEEPPPLPPPLPEEQYTPIEPAEAREYYTLSPAQKRMYILKQMAPDSTVYNVSEVFQFDGEPDMERLNQAFDKLVARYESFRTSFLEVDGEPVQIILDFVPFSVGRHQTTPQNLDQVVTGLLKPYDLSIPPLLRVNLIAVAGAGEDGGTGNLLHVDMHHIISDGASHLILVRDFFDFYNGRDHLLPPLNLHYKDFSQWRSGKTQQAEIARQREFWLKQFAGEIPLLHLPTDFTRPAIQSFDGDSIRFELEEGQALILAEMARAEQTTMFMLLLTVFNVFLAKISGQEDIVVGTPIAGRRHPDLARIIGMFANTIGLRNRAQTENTFTQFLARVKSNALEAFENQDYQFEELVDAVAVSRDAGRNPLFDVMFVLQVMDKTSVEQNLPKPQFYEVKEKISKFDMTLKSIEDNDQLIFDLEYCTRLFEKETIQRFILYFRNLVSEIIAHPGETLSSLEFISPQEKKDLLTTFNETAAPYPSDKTVPMLFAEQLAKTPLHVALVGVAGEGIQSVTYSELDRKSSLLAGKLKDKGAHAGDIIGIMGERSVEMVVRVLAILKAGCAYLPLESDAPAERIRYMLKDSNAILLLNDGMEELNSQSGPIGQPGSPVQSTGLCYVIYTSGTTGRPKGVMVNHRSVVRLVKNSDYVPLDEGDSILQTGALAFDASTFEIWGTLLNGLRLHLLSREDLLSAANLKKAMLAFRITTLFMTTALFNQMSDTDIRIFSSLKYIMVGGEILSPPHMNRIRAAFPRLRVSNIYGPTENTTFSTSYLIQRDYDDNIPIGGPIANSTAYILDQRGKLQPIGVNGELCLGGDGLAMGYMNDPELTADKFVPFTLHPSPSTIYRTGDLARWLPGGVIQFNGRMDGQIKLRGFRVELGEIETRLLMHEDTKEAIVLARKDDKGGLYLCAWVSGEENLDIAILKEYLSQSLPAYMVPTHITIVDEMPLNQNGKIDRNALPEPVLGGNVQQFISPANDIEYQLAAIWAEVLDLEPATIGTADDFFQLGGHSLKATVLISKIHKALDVKIPLAEVFKTPSIKALAHYIQSAAKDRFISIPPAEEREYYPVSSAQKRIFILQQVDPGGTVYNMPEMFELTEPPSVEKLEHTFNQLIRRHQSLRTSFHLINDRPVQKIHEEAEFEISRYHPEDMDRFVRPFDLSAAPLLRVGLVHTAEDRHVLMVDMHHIISDGLSHEILIKDYMALFEGNTLPPLRIHYKDYAQWQNSGKQNHLIASQEAYWLDRLESEDELPVLELPVDFPRPTVQGFRGDIVRFRLEPGETLALKAMASREGVTLYMVLLSQINILMTKLCGQEDVLIGTPVAGRRHADLEPIIGMFVNTLVLRNTPAGEQSFLHFLKEVKTNTLEAFENQEYPFEDLVDKVWQNRDAGRNPLFDVMYVLQNIPLKTGQSEENKDKGKGYLFKDEIAKFDLTLTGLEEDDAIDFIIQYRIDLFKEPTIRRFAQYFKNIVSAVISSPEEAIADIDIIPEQERKQLLLEFNNTTAPYPAGKTVPQLFAEQVEKTPGHIALLGVTDRHPGHVVSITYRELNRQAGHLVKELRKKGCRPGGIIGIMGQRSLEMVIRTLAILKTGCAYLPIESDAPKERIQYMLNDGKVSLLLSHRIEVVKPLNTTSHNLEPSMDPTQPCYVIYTSGTTGRPKGVMVNHRSVVRLVKNTNYVPLDQGDRILQTGALAFDASTFEIWGTLLNGLSLCLLSKETILTPPAFKKAMLSYQVTTLFITTALFNQMLDADIDIYSSLKYLMVGGEILSPPHMNRIRAKFPRLQVSNIYGPTENTTFSTSHVIRRDYDDNIPIGVPISNSTAYVLDKRVKLQPLGVAGELCVGGDGLAIGYLNDPELTAEKFVPFTIHPSPLTIYRTGDMARWLPEGAIEFIGRVDNQVKIRGFRIEPGEIETCLLMQEAIKEAIVLVKKDSGDGLYLCAYIVADRELEIEGLKSDLAVFLPQYMVPNYIIPLERMPLNQNGKIDRKALPEPSLSGGTGLYVPPQGETEQRLVSIWSDVLGVEPGIIGATDNFFELGGHSLKATVLVSRVHKTLDVRLPLAEVFRTPYIRDLAIYIQTAAKDRFVSIQTAEEKEYYPLSSAQRRLFILQQMETGNTVYNMPEMFELQEKPAKEKLEGTFKLLIQRHQSLRTSFHIDDDFPMQKVHEHVEFAIQHFDPGTGAADFIRPFDLSQAPLLRVGLMSTEEDRHVLMVDMHHIISDGVSHKILLRDFMALYEGNTLPPLRLHYKDYAQWQNSGQGRKIIEKQENYWLKRFQPEDEFPVLTLPADFARPPLQRFDGATTFFQLEPGESKSLKTLASDQGVTLYMVLLGLLNILLAKLGGQEDIIVGTPAAARRHADLETIIGMFVNTLVLRNAPEGNKRVREFLRDLKTDTLKAFENQEYPFEDLVEKVWLNRDPSRNPMFDVMFVMHDNEFTGEDNPDSQKQKKTDQASEEKGYRFEDQISKFDMTFTAMDNPDGLSFVIQYCTALFKESTMQRFTGYFKAIALAVLENPQLRIADIAIISEAEKKRLLLEFNDTEAQFPAGKTIHRLFEEQVEKTPGAIALTGSNRENKTVQLSYSRLNHDAGLAAKYLHKTGIQPGNVVALKMADPLELAVSLFGVLKAGCAYLPIDPAYPRERIDYMLKDSNAAILMEDLSGLEAGAVESGEPVDLPSSSLCYVIYTSGSTGRPKAVAVEHRSAVNTLYCRKQVYRLDHRSVNLQLFSFSFDGFVAAFFTPLISGARVVFPGGTQTKDIQAIKQAVVREKVTHFIAVPPLFQAILDTFSREEATSIRVVTLAGDRLLIQLLEKTRQTNRNIEIVHEYGVTEAAVMSTLFRHQEQSGTITIGKPAANTRIYILNKYLTLQPLGAGGELCIAGAGLARGYLNQPELTAQRFVNYKENPFTVHRSPFTVYRTGDLARWLPDGNIEFLGRMDHQVKVRGFRIELGEIENRLLSHEFINEALVLVKKNQGSENEIRAYIVPQNEKDIQAEEIKAYLSHCLPDYMLPSHIVHLEEFPLSPNGKIDRHALPEPSKSDDITPYTTPADETEHLLVSIWSEVLDLDAGDIGVLNDFFQLGGHSLKATVMTARIHKALNVNIPLAEVFKTPNIRGLARYIQSAEEERFFAVEPAEEKEYYILSPAQKRMYILQQMKTANTVYNMPEIFEFPEPPEKDKLEQTFRRLIQRHQSLRTSFHLVGDEPVQRIHTGVDFTIDYFGPSTDSSGFIRPFDLSLAPLLRVALAHTAEDRHILMVDMHHIISDGVSHDILLRDYMDIYEGKELPPILIHYKDYAQWQHNGNGKEIIQRQETYWLKQFEFEDEMPVLDLPLDFARPPVQRFDGNTLRFQLAPAESRLLKTMAAGEGATLYMVLLGLFNILMAKLSGQKDIILGTPVAGRRHADLQAIIGMFVNTLVLRNAPQGEKSVREFLGEVKSTTLSAFENQEYPFEVLVEKVWQNRDAGRNPLFDVMFVMQNIDMSSAGIHEDSAGKDDKTGESGQQHLENQISKFDMTFTAVETDDGIEFLIQYCTALFEKESIHRYAQYFKNIVSHAVTRPGQLISEIEIIPEEEKIKLLADFNRTATSYPSDKTIFQLFEEQCEKSPHLIALVDAAGTHHDHPVSISYDRLKQEAGKVAGTLREKGLRAGDIAGIMGHRSIATIVHILAVLKAGAAYLPLEPGAPPERIKYMLKDSNAVLLINRDIRVLRSAANRPDGRKLPAEAANPCYIIYTSGTTGRPKGVMVSHGNVARLVKNTNYIQFRENDRILQTGALAFDASTFEIWGALLNGLTLVLVPNENILMAGSLKQDILKQKINVMWITSSLFNQMLDSDINIFDGLRVLLVGGEALSPPHIDKLRTTFPQLQIVNGYGPTENTTFSTTHLIEREYGGPIPIGKPIANSTAYILDEHGNPQPIGVAGELYVGGDGVAIGYLNDPELTAQRFVNYSSQLSSSYPPILLTSYRLYKTGDRARWLPEGVIEFLGRLDDQVKIRGFRIEPGEIENLLAARDLVKAAAVLVKNDARGNPRLFAYVVSDPDLDLAGLKESLNLLLPNYMVPDYFITLDRIPLTPNGKLDRRALPEPRTSQEFSKDIEKYTGPSDELEEQLVAIWSEILELEPEAIDIEESFFNLGGHSLKAAVLMSSIQDILHVKIPLIEFFRSPDIKNLANATRRLKALVPEQSAENLVLLKKCDSKDAKHIFFIHDGTGEADGYIKLSQLMTLDFNCWGIRADKLDTLAPENRTMEETVKKYISRIKSIQPTGSGHYYIAGWSIGGAIAFEMARHLQMENEKIAFLGLIDTIPPVKKRWFGPQKLNLKSELKFARKIFHHDKILKLLKKAKTTGDFWIEIFQYLENGHFDLRIFKKRIKKIGMDALTDFHLLSLREHIFYLNTIRTLLTMVNNYTPAGKSTVPMYYFQAEQSGDVKALQWNKYTAPPVQYYKVPGDHFSILRPPNVSTFVQTFEEVLKHATNKK